MKEGSWPSALAHQRHGLLHGASRALGCRKENESRPKSQFHEGYCSGQRPTRVHSGGEHGARSRRRATRVHGGGEQNAPPPRRDAEAWRESLGRSVHALPCGGTRRCRYDPCVVYSHGRAMLDGCCGIGDPAIESRCGSPSCLGSGARVWSPQKSSPATVESALGGGKETRLTSPFSVLGLSSFLPPRSRRGTSSKTKTPVPSQRYWRSPLVPLVVPQALRAPPLDPQPSQRFSMRYRPFLDPAVSGWTTQLRPLSLHW